MRCVPLAAGQQRARRLTEQSIAHDARRAVFSLLLCRVVAALTHCNRQAYDAGVDDAGDALDHAAALLLLCAQDVSGPINAVGKSSQRTRVVICAGRNDTAAALVAVEMSTAQHSSASGCEHSAATSDSFTTNRRSRRYAVFSFRGRQAAAAPFYRYNAWPSATMLRLEARFFAPNVWCVWPCPWLGCQNETWPSALLRHTQQREQTCRGENVSRHAEKSCRRRNKQAAVAVT
jgi:hypothetical protein